MRWMKKMNVKLVELGDIINSVLRKPRRNNRNVEGEILIFLGVYEILPYASFKQFLKISKKNYEMIDRILWMLVYQKQEGEDVKEDIELFIESKRFDVNNTVRDINIVFIMMHERSTEHRVLSHHQLHFCPELKL